MVSGAGSGGGSGELASKLSGGMRTVYTGSPAEADGGGEFSVPLRCGGSGGERAPTSWAGWECGGGADLGDSMWARGKSHEQAEASAWSESIWPPIKLTVPPCGTIMLCSEN